MNHTCDVREILKFPFYIFHAYIWNILHKDKPVFSSLVQNDASFTEEGKVQTFGVESHLKKHTAYCIVNGKNRLLSLWKPEIGSQRGLTETHDRTENVFAILNLDNTKFRHLA